MAWPVPEQYPISTAYGKRGSSWSCNENSSGGVHTGADFACPAGTPVYAAVAGQVRFRSYGSAFGNHQLAISPDAGEPFGDGEVFYAHMRKRLGPDGTRVEIGDWVGEVGTEGNVTGAHLHFEFHPHTKGTWSCSVHANPDPVLEHEGDDVALSDDDVQRIAAAVWQYGKVISTSLNVDGTTDDDPSWRSAADVAYDTRYRAIRGPADG